MCDRVFLNIVHDEIAFKLNHTEPIHSVAFSDTSSIVSTATSSLIFTWDLFTRQILTSINTGNEGPSNLVYLPGNNTLVCTSLNAIKVYHFDTSTSARLLNERTGHTAPPTTVKYLHPATGGFECSNADATVAGRKVIVMLNNHFYRYNANGTGAGI